MFNDALDGMEVLRQALKQKIEPQAAIKLAFACDDVSKLNKASRSLQRKLHHGLESLAEKLKPEEDVKLEVKS